MTPIVSGRLRGRRDDAKATYDEPGFEAPNGYDSYGDPRRGRCHRRG